MADTTAALVARLRAAVDALRKDAAPGDGVSVSSLALLELDAVARVVADALETPHAAAEVGAIRERHEANAALGYVPSEATRDRATLLAEVDRLTAALAAAERERLLLARRVTWERDVTSEMVDPPRAEELREALQLARSVVAAARAITMANDTPDADRALLDRIACQAYYAGRYPEDFRGWGGLPENDKRRWRNVAAMALTEARRATSTEAPSAPAPAAGADVEGLLREADDGDAHTPDRYKGSTLTARLAAALRASEAARAWADAAQGRAEKECEVWTAWAEEVVEAIGLGDEVLASMRASILATVKEHEAARVRAEAERDALAEEKRTDSWHTGWQEAVKRLSESERMRHEAAKLFDADMQRVGEERDAARRELAAATDAYKDAVEERDAAIKAAAMHRTEAEAARRELEEVRAQGVEVDGVWEAIQREAARDVSPETSRLLADRATHAVCVYLESVGVVANAVRERAGVAGEVVPRVTEADWQVLREMQGFIDDTQKTLAEMREKYGITDAEVRRAGGGR